MDYDEDPAPWCKSCDEWKKHATKLKEKIVQLQSELARYRESEINKAAEGRPTRGQLISVIYGNTRASNPHVTLEMVEAVVDYHEKARGKQWAGDTAERTAKDETSDT